MDSRIALLAILGGVALTIVIGILLNPYIDSSGQKEVAEKAGDYTNTADETIKDSGANVKTQLQKMIEDTERMVNEGGNVL